MTNQEEEWRDNPNKVYIINGIKYDYLSAHHNGIIGNGKLLRDSIKEVNREILKNSKEKK